jgi:hypothetical protein
MKRHGYLYDPIISFDNLIRAANNTQRGKRFKRSNLKFNHNPEGQLVIKTGLRLRSALNP